MRFRVRQCLTGAKSTLSSRPYSSTSSRIIKEHDVLFLRQRGIKSAKWHLTPPLKPGATVKLSYGATISASDLIGRRLLDRVSDSRGERVVLTEPTLGSYILNSNASRLATPIYPHDASTIVSLLDIHPTRPGEEEDEGVLGAAEFSAQEPFEVFEAGTGMGSLTLHLARALHAANPPVGPALRHEIANMRFRTETRLDPTGEAEDSAAAEDAAALAEGNERDTSALILEHMTTASATSTSSSSPSSSSSSSPPPSESISSDPLLHYRKTRRAIIHTLDRNPRHSRSAFSLIRNFRRALYLPAIDFHAAISISSFISSRLAATRGQPFLARAVLDLPDAPLEAGPVVSALRPGGLLAVFAPSVSQIGELAAWAKASGLPVRLEKVVELPTTTSSPGAASMDGSGGRLWDVKIVMTRGEDAREVQVMRPKVGERVAGGGFVAVLRKYPVDEEIVNDGLTEGHDGRGASEESGTDLAR